MTTKKWVSLPLIAVVILLSFVYYKQNHLSIWGFNLPKNDLKDIIVQTDKHSYLITDKNMVLKIAEDTRSGKNIQKSIHSLLILSLKNTKKF